jgi:hypothetical protein
MSASSVVICFLGVDRFPGGDRFLGVISFRGRDLELTVPGDTFSKIICADMRRRPHGEPIGRTVAV